MVYFPRVEGKATNKNVWIPAEISSFIRIQWALDNRPAVNKARVTDIVQGLVDRGYWLVINMLEGEGLSAKKTVSFDMVHTRNLDDGDSQQYAVPMNDTCRKSLASIVKMVELGDIEFLGGDAFNMSDAMINLLLYGCLDVILHPEQPPIQ